MHTLNELEIINTRLLKKNLKSLKTIVSSDSVLPILESVLFKRGCVIATNLDICCSIPFPYQGDDCVVELRILNKIFSNFKDGNFYFTRDIENFIINNTNGEKIKIRLIEKANDYPQTNPQLTAQKNVINEKTPFTIAFNDNYIKSIIKAMPFASSDDLRPVMCGIYCLRDSLIATDAHCLIIEKIADGQASSPQGEFAFILPRSTFAFIKSKPANFVLWKSVKDEFVIEYQDGTCFAFKNDDSKYLDYNAVIPKNNEIEITIDEPFDFMRKLQLGGFAVNRALPEVKFKISHGIGMMQFEIKDYDYRLEYQNETPIQSNGDITISFRYDFLLKCLKLKSSKQFFTMRLSSPNKAVRIDDDLLIMPVVTH